jgi:hypothetical protein
MRFTIVGLAIAGMLLVLPACASDGHGFGGGVYDAYYDGAYGPCYDGYWGDDGAFYYRGGPGRAFSRDGGGHFQHGPGAGFHGMHAGRRG